jgi:hypothetical protein
MDLYFRREFKRLIDTRTGRPIVVEEEWFRADLPMSSYIGRTLTLWVDPVGKELRHAVALEF